MIQDSTSAPIATSSTVQDAGLQNVSLGETAHAAIQHHFKKATKYKKAVLKDTDPENLHQMRVGLRRLRTSLKVFDFALKLPKAARDRRLQEIARGLGTVRDLDVLHDLLINRYMVNLPQLEQRQLYQVLSNLGKQRQVCFEKMGDLLRGDRYRTFKQAYAQWIRRPEHQAQVAALPMRDCAPDLLLPLYCHLFQHPGWLIGTQMHSQQVQVLSVSGLRDDRLSQQLRKQEVLVHDLRKLIKQVRYQSDLLKDFYGDDYEKLLQDLKQSQEVLGGLQDMAVCRDVITTIVKGKLHKKMPYLVEQFHQTQAELWQEWQPIQRQYLNSTVRTQVKQILMNPK